MKSLNQLSNEGIRFIIVKQDTTQYWKEDIVKKAGKIECVYIVDLTQPTHLCELSVSYPAQQLKNFVENFEAFDEDTLTELERENLEDCKYFTGNSTFNIEREYGNEELMEFDEIFDYENANPSVC